MTKHPHLVSDPANVPASELTHVLYCFADIDPTTGNIVLSDSYADTDKHYATDSWNDVVRHAARFLGSYRLTDARLSRATMCTATSSSSSCSSKPTAI